MLDRRIFLRSAAMLLLAGAVEGLALPVLAKDGGHESDGHDSDGHESDGHESDGHDKDGGHDDNGHDDDGGHDDNRGKRKGMDQDDALRELKKGKIIPLKTALKIVDAKVEGKLIDVSLTKTFGRAQYRFKIRRADGRITTIRLDARTGGFVDMLGF